MCRETATEISRMKKFNNVLPRYRVTLVRESEDTFAKYPKYQNSRELFDGFREELSALDREHFFLVTLDSKNRTIGYHTISIGSLSCSIVLKISPCSCSYFRLTWSLTSLLNWICSSLCILFVYFHQLLELFPAVEFPRE